MADRRRTTAAELTAPTAKLAKDMRQGEGIVAKSTRRMERNLNRTSTAAARAGRSTAAPGIGRRLSGHMGGYASRAGGTLRAAAAFGGAYGLQAEMRKAKQYEETLVDLAVRGGKTKKWVDSLRGRIKAASNEFGVGKEQIAEYVGTIIDQTGNTKLATDTLRDMTAVAYSANVPMGELAGTVVEMQSKLALAPKEFKLALGVLAAQADKGKVPLSQMSKYLPEVLNATTQFGHTGVGALRDYGAVLQMAARGAGSLAEANTAMNRMLDQTAAKRGKIEKALNIKLKKNGAWLQLAPMLKEIVAGLIRMKSKGKDVEKFIVKTWGIRGKKAILPMLQQGMQGWDARVGSDAAGQGGLTSFNALVAAGDASTIDQRVSRKRKLSPQLNAWNKATEKFKNRIHEHLLPALNRLGNMMPKLGKGLTFLLDNWRTLLTLWGSAKMAMFFSRLLAVPAGAAGGGGVPGAGGVIVAGGGGGRGTRKQRRRARAKGGLLSALSVLPLIGDSEEIADLGQTIGTEGRIDAQRQRGMKGAWGRGADLRNRFVGAGRTGLVDWQYGAGKTQKGKVDRLIANVNKDPSRLNKLTPEETKKLLGYVSGQHYTASKAVEGAMDLPTTGPLAPSESTRRGMVEEAAPMVAQLRKIEELLKQRLKVTVNLVDPNKTPAGVTQSRKGKKR